MSVLEQLRKEAYEEFGQKFERATSKGVINFIRRFTESNSQLFQEMVEESITMGIDKENFSIYHLPRFFLESMTESKYIWMLLMILEAQERGYQMAYRNIDTLLFDSYLDQIGKARLEAKSIVRDILQKNEQQEGLFDEVLDLLIKLNEKGINKIEELNNLQEFDSTD